MDIKEKIKANRNSIIIGVLLFAVAVYVTSNKYFVIIASTAVINAIAVEGIIIVSGYAKQLNLGQAAFMGIGAYTTGVLLVKAGVPYLVTFPVAILFSTIMGWVLAIPTLKLKGGSYLALVTQIFGEIIYVFILNAEDLTNGAFGISNIKAPELGIINLGERKCFFWFCLFCLVLVYIILKMIVNSRFGRFFISIRESEDAAESLGINTRKYKTYAFMIAAAAGGLSGCLYAANLRYLSPEQFRWSPSLTLVSMAIVGGLYDLEGGILGAILLTALPELLRFSDDFRMIAYGAIVIIVLAFMPNGLISLWGKTPKEIKEMLSKQWEELTDKELRMKRKSQQTAKA